MGMVLRYQRLPPNILAALKARPSLVSGLLLPSERAVEVDGVPYSTPKWAFDSVRSLPKRKQLKAARQALENE